MARIYAGVFGPLAFLTTLARGALHGGSADSTLLAAWCSLMVFSAVGCVVGWLAGSTIEQSVRTRISAELSTRDAVQEVTPADVGP